jgi:hypothetical protein
LTNVKFLAQVTLAFMTGLVIFFAVAAASAGTAGSTGGVMVAAMAPTITEVEKLAARNSVARNDVRIEVAPS